MAGGRGAGARTGARGAGGSGSPRAHAPQVLGFPRVPSSRESPRRAGRSPAGTCTLAGGEGGLAPRGPRVHGLEAAGRLPPLRRSNAGGRPAPGGQRSVRGTRAGTTLTPWVLGAQSRHHAFQTRGASPPARGAGRAGPTAGAGSWPRTRRSEETQSRWCWRCRSGPLGKPGLLPPLRGVWVRARHRSLPSPWWESRTLTPRSSSCAPGVYPAAPREAQGERGACAQRRARPSGQSSAPGLRMAFGFRLGLASGPRARRATFRAGEAGRRQRRPDGLRLVL